MADTVTTTWMAARIKAIISKEFDTFHPTPAIERMVKRIMAEVVTKS